MSREAIEEAIEVLEDASADMLMETGDKNYYVEAIAVLRQALEEKREPVAWMGIDIEGNPNKFRLNFFGGAIPLFVRNEDRTTIADNEKDGSPCPEFWDWLPRAYNFDGDGVFTKYNMEVAFLAGKQFADADDTSQKRVDEKAKREQEPVITQEAVECMCGLCKLGKREWVGLTDEEKSDLWCESTGRDCVNEDTHVFADAIEAKLREKNHG